MNLNRIFELSSGSFGFFDWRRAGLAAGFKSLQPQLFFSRFFAGIRGCRFPVSAVAGLN
jgi:hypothetical protein